MFVCTLVLYRYTVYMKSLLNGVNNISDKTHMPIRLFRIMSIPTTFRLFLVLTSEQIGRRLPVFTLLLWQQRQISIKLFYLYQRLQCRDKYFFKIKFVFFLYLRLSASSKEYDLPLCIYTYRLEILLCTLAPEVQCRLVHRNHVICRTKITKFWRNGNDSKQPYYIHRRTILQTKDHVY
jgi:hypothetical protein